MKEAAGTVAAVASGSGVGLSSATNGAAGGIGDVVVGGGGEGGGRVGIQWVVVQHILLEKEDYIVRNLQWNRGLHEKLIQEGLLPVNAEEEHGQLALIHCVLDHIHHSVSPSKFVLFCQSLAEHGNVPVSEHLWSCFRMNHKAPVNVSPVQKAYPTPVSKETTTILRSRLQDVTGEASELKHRLSYLEDDHYKMSMFVSRAMDFEDEVTVKLGSLEDTKDMLRTQLSKKDQGLDLWRKKEKEYIRQLESMQERMDDMSRLIRSKDQQLDSLHRRTDKQQQEIQLLLARAADSNKKRSNNNHHHADPFVRQPVAKSVKRDKPPLKLPTIVKVLHGPVNSNSNSHRSMDNSWQSPARAHQRYGSENNLVMTSTQRGLQMMKPQLKPLSPILGTPDTDISRKPMNVLQIKPQESDRKPLNVLRQSLVCSHREYICNSCEKWISDKGGSLDMPSLHMTVPANSLTKPVCMKITEVQQQGQIRELIDSVGLHDLIEPSIFLELQPHGLRFAKEVFLEVKGYQIASPSKLLVFHKDVNFYDKTKWTDISRECSPRSHKQNIVLTLGQFCDVQAFKLTTSINHQSGMEKLASMIMHTLNGDILLCQFHVFLDDFEQKLVVLCLPHKSANASNEAFTKDVLSAFFKRGLDYLGHAKSLVSICDNELLYFYLDEDESAIFKAKFHKEETETTGQVFKISINESKRMPSGRVTRPESRNMLLRIQRKLLSEVQDIFRLKLRQQDKAVTRQMTEMDVFNTAELQNLYKGLQRKVVTTVDIKHLLEDMKSQDVFFAEEEEQILAEKSPQNRARAFLDKLGRKGPRGLGVFCQVLEGKHQGILEDIRQAVNVPMSISTDSSSGD